MSRALRILFLSNRGLLPIKDGHTRRSYNILKGLSKKYQIYFLSLYETQEEIKPENINELKMLCHDVEFYPAPSKKMGIHMLLRLFRSLVSADAYTIWRHYSPSLLRRVDELISSGEFDIIHCDILPLAYTVRKRNGIFRSITDHDVSYLKCLRMGKKSKNPLLKLFLYLESWKLKKLENKIFNQVDLGIVVSELDKDILSALCPGGEFVVIENGVETDKFIPDNKHIEQNKLIWLGGFDDYSNKQGIYFFLESIYPKIKKRKPGIRFDIIGSGITQKLRQLVNGDDTINLMGYVDDPLPYIQRASVFVVPILSGGGTRLKVLEAMAVGKAIISTSIGCEGINGINGEHYIIADNVNSFTEAIVQLLQDSLLRMRLGSNARKLVADHYDYERICGKLNELYERLIEKNKHMAKNIDESGSQRN
jgi:polysaccharide biosynthesis protein PslH